MKIDISQLQKGSGPLELSADAVDYPSLNEIGVGGGIELVAKVIPMDNKYWINGSVKGSLSQDCPKCTSEILCKFKVDLKILIEFWQKNEVVWGSDEDMNFDEYSVQMGPNITHFEVTDQIREQILLNCDIMSPSANLQVPVCKSCMPIHNEKNRIKEQSTDPRWEKLKDLL